MLSEHTLTNMDGIIVILVIFNRCIVIASFATISYCAIRFAVSPQLSTVLCLTELSHVRPDDGAKVSKRISRPSVRQRRNARIEKLFPAASSANGKLTDESDWF